MAVFAEENTVEVSQEERTQQNELGATPRRVNVDIKYGLKSYGKVEYENVGKKRVL